MSSQVHTTVKPENDSQIDDTEYRAGLEFLRTNCPAFQRFERETIQFIVDQMYGANCLIAATERDIVSVTKTMKNLHTLKLINQEMIERARR